MKKINWKSLGKVLKDILEIYIPAIFFLILFASFLIGIVARYVFNNPQSWTFELSSISYLAVAVLAWGIAHRTDENVVFDMLYNRLSARTQCILRIIRNLVMAVVSALLIYPSVTYLASMFELKTQIIKIPRFLVFLPFTVSFISTAVRSIYRLVLDVRALKSRDYLQRYGRQEEAE